MATDEFLLDRMRQVLASLQIDWSEKRMFGGNCFMVDDKMLVGTYKGGIMARVDPQEIPELVERQGAEQMIHGGRNMTGYLMISPEGYDRDDDLTFWLEKCLAFNPKAKASKKKKK